MNIEFVYDLNFEWSCYVKSFLFNQVGRLCQFFHHSLAKNWDFWEKSNSTQVLIELLVLTYNLSGCSQTLGGAESQKLARSWTIASPGSSSPVALITIFILFNHYLCWFVWMRFLWVLHFPSTVQKHRLRSAAEAKLALRVCVRLNGLCVSSDGLETCPGCIPLSAGNPTRQVR